MTKNRLHRFHAKGKRVYERLKPRLERRHRGEVIAIEAESGGYVMGRDELDVLLRAMKKFPGKKFSFFRIGYPAVHKL